MDNEDQTQYQTFLGRYAVLN